MKFNQFDLFFFVQKTLKIQDVPIMASGGGSSAPAPAASVYQINSGVLFDLIFIFQKKEEDEEESPRPTAQSVFKVRLIKFDETKKVPVIKQVKDIVENINLVQVINRFFF